MYVCMYVCMYVYLYITLNHLTRILLYDSLKHGFFSTSPLMFSAKICRSTSRLPRKSSADPFATPPLWPAWPGRWCQRSKPRAKVDLSSKHGDCSKTKMVDYGGFDQQI